MDIWVFLSVMKNAKLVKLIGIISVLSGLTVIIGWIFNIEPIKSVLPGLVTMKFSTALCFVLSGIMLCSISGMRKGDSVSVVLIITLLCILLIMGNMLFFSFTGLRAGIEELFVKEANGAQRSVVPGMPSVATMVNFVLIGLAGIFVMLNLSGIRLKLQAIGSIIMAIGTVGIIGYMADIPILYYEIKGVSTAMALHTAVLFILLGIGLILSAKEK